MVDINKTVGELGVNSSEDVALVQLMLRVVKNAKGQPYFAGEYNGAYNAALKTAIQSFQEDQKLIAAQTPPGAKQPAKAAPPLPVPASNEKPGLLGPGTKTLDALNAKLPADYKEIRIIKNTKTIYVAQPQAQATAMAAEIRNKTSLNADFREKVAQLVEAMHKEHKIVLKIPNDGWRRDFQSQVNVGTATSAGPGESPHQFGRAVDIGFQGLKWVAGNGQFKTDNYWLASQGLSNAKQMEFWQARNNIAFQKLGLFKTNKPGDLVHIQGFSDSSLSWGKSLARLMETASPTHAKWSVVGGAPNTYKIDPGLGMSLSAGSSRQMWEAKSPVNKTELVKALNAKLAADPTFSVEKFFGEPAKPNPPAGTPAAPAAKPAPLKEADITANRLQFIQKLIQSEIKSADQNWDKWTAAK